jgi:dipeptide/tripeptide permease
MWNDVSLIHKKKNMGGARDKLLTFQFASHAQYVHREQKEVIKYAARIVMFDRGYETVKAGVNELKKMVAASHILFQDWVYWRCTAQKQVQRRKDRGK